MKNIDSINHTKGTSIYVDDVPMREGSLHAAVIDARVAHGNLKAVDLTQVRKQPGVVAILEAADIPGENQIGGIIPDEPLFAEDQVHYQGQPIALVLAESESQAREAAKLAKLTIDPLPVVVDPREARRRNQLIIPPRTFRLGDVDNAWSECAHIFEGEADSGGQEHLYIETQGAYATPTEKDGVHIISSTQGPTAVQRTVAKVLALPMHQVEVDVTRLGGGFGGKEDQATPWAVMAALGAHLLKRPVKLVLHRLDDLRMTGKRHPYRSDFKIGLTEDLRILAYEATFHQNAGAAADLSPAVMERTLFHATNSYRVPNVKATAYSCRTNLPPNTAFRGFGGPQGMFVMEAAIAAAAEQLGIDPGKIQKKNLIRDGDCFPYGQIVQGSQAEAAWTDVEKRFDLANTQREIAAFNQSHSWQKKGLALMPVCFGISFTKTHMNQASALVHVYQDGSVGVSTAAVEMGQGVNTKMLQVAQQVFSIDSGRIKIETTNTTRVANTSPTAASAAADLNGKAVEQACGAIVQRLKAQAAKELNADAAAIEMENETLLINGKATDWTWTKLVTTAFLNRVNLSAHAQYATPKIHFDPTKEKGHPFAYHAFGTALTVATVDCLRGRYVIDAVKVVHDFGKSMNPIIDRGQAEGGIVQGIGWMTMEEVIYDEKGQLRSNALSTYKVPDLYGVPKDLQVHFLEGPGSPHAIFKSKAIGEPPLMYGIGAYFAIRNAVRRFRPKGGFPFCAPMTPEKVLLALYPAEQPAKASATKTDSIMEPVP